MPLSEKLKNWLVEHAGVTKDASDDDFRKAAASCVTDGSLAPELLAELTKEETPSTKDRVSEILEQRIGKMLDEKLAKLSAAPKPTVEEPSADEAKDADDEARIDALVAAAAKKAEVEVEKIFSNKARAGNAEQKTDPSPHVAVFAAGSQPDVKRVDAMYSTTKSAVIGPEYSTNPRTGERKPSFHPYAGRPVIMADSNPKMGYRQLETLSDLERAISGAVWKWKIIRAGYGQIHKGLKLTDHDKELLKYALNELPCVGYRGQVDYTSGEPDGGTLFKGQLDRAFAKALLDDSTSEGDEVVPEFFDADLIRAPVLFGELFPQVEVRTVNRHLVEGASISTPTVEVGPAEGSADTLETTTNFFAELNTTVNPFMGSIEVGLDWESDTPINVMAELSAGYSDALMNQLDNQIANGTGSTNGFTGIFQTTGTTAVSSANGTSGPLTIGDLEQLAFGVPKQTRNARGSRNCFVSNETTYRRARAIAVSGTDQRRVLGMETSTHQSFSALGWPWKIQGDIADNDLAFTNFGFYRVYRRAGMSIRRVEGDRTGALANTFVVILRARFGGRNMLASAIAEMNDAPQTG